MRGWLAARSLSRGLPAPVDDHGGWRVDTGSDEERCRYVFAEPAGLAALAATIDRPRHFVKLCADEATLRALLPPRWSILPSNWMMVRRAAAGSMHLPDGFTLDRHTADSVTRIEIAAPDGTHAARGYAAESDGVFAYDRIVTEEPYRRRGLGRTLMAALAQERRDPAAREVLTATAMGRALYETIGWRVYAPYTTAVLPDPSSPAQ